jgi:DNA-binding XRE family transcriptional regulator
MGLTGELPGLSFAGLLRQSRAEARLTQQELAEAASLPPLSISDPERGINRTARKDTAGRPAGALSLAGAVRELLVAAARGTGAMEPSHQASRTLRQSRNAYI